MLRMRTTQHDFIGGTVIVVLQDGSSIKCVDRGRRDQVNGESRALYTLTKAELETLSSIRIAFIRFNVKSEINGMPESACSAANRNPWGVRGSAVAPDTDYDTEVEVAKLLASR